MAISEKNNFNPFDYDHYSEQVKKYFSRMKIIRDNIKLNRVDYDLDETMKQEFLKMLDILLKDENSNHESIEGYFDIEISDLEDMNEIFKVYEKYYFLLKDCYGRPPYQMLSMINMDEKLEQLKSKKLVKN